MKRLLIILTALVCSFQGIGQVDSIKIRMNKKNLVTVVDSGHGSQVKVGNEGGVEVITDDRGDTTRIRVGSRIFEVVDEGEETHIEVERDRDIRKWTGNFNAHWAGVEWGINTFQNTDYSMYSGDSFMELNYPKSIAFNLNFAEWAFRNRANNFALVTGLGFSFKDFVFDNPVTIINENNRIQPLPLTQEGLKKSKLHVSYFTVPLMFEWKTPLRLRYTRVYIGAGVIGGLYLGSHTKYKYKNDKYKDKGRFNINQFTYDLTARIGFGDLCIFANYSMVPLFETNRGPELHPLTIGFSFPNI